MSRYENAPAFARTRGANQNTLQRNYSTDPETRLLGLLENVRTVGQGTHRADCPNGHRSRGSLSITLKDDGMLLVKCHSGCTTLEVLNAVGLELANLYDRPVTVNMSPGQRRELREKVKMARWKSARPDILIEMQVLLSFGGQAYRGEPISDADMDRMKIAGVRIRNALGEL